MPEAGNRLSRWVNGVVLLLVGRAAPGSSKTTHTSADEAALGWLGRATAVSGSALLRHTASRRARQRRSITAVPAGTSTPPLTSNNEAGPRQGGRSWSQSGAPTAGSDSVTGPLTSGFGGAPRGIRTPNRQIRSQPSPIPAPPSHPL